MKSFISHQIHLSVLFIFFACFLFLPVNAEPCDKDKQQNSNEIEQIKLQLIEMQKEIDSLKTEFSILNDSFQIIHQLISPATEEIIDSIPKLFDVSMENHGTSKLNVINEVYRITGLGLKTSKELVDHLPSIIKSDLSEEEALSIQLRLENAGAVVKLIPKD